MSNRIKICMGLLFVGFATNPAWAQSPPASPGPTEVPNSTYEKTHDGYVRKFFKKLFHTDSHNKGSSTEVVVAQAPGCKPGTCALQPGNPGSQTTAYPSLSTVGVALPPVSSDPQPALPQITTSPTQVIPGVTQIPGTITIGPASTNLAPPIDMPAGPIPGTINAAPGTPASGTTIPNPLPNPPVAIPSPAPAPDSTAPTTAPAIPPAADSASTKAAYAQLIELIKANQERDNRVLREVIENRQATQILIRALQAADAATVDQIEKMLRDMANDLPSAPGTVRPPAQTSPISGTTSQIQQAQRQVTREEVEALIQQLKAR